VKPEVLCKALCSVDYPPKQSLRPVAPIPYEYTAVPLDGLTSYTGDFPRKTGAVGPHSAPLHTST
jgi:hypothetical protein